MALSIPEKAFLGTLLKANHLISDTSIKPEQLEESRHKILFTEIKRLVKEKKPVDRVTLAMSANIEGIGGLSYVNELLTYADETKFEEYEKLVFESWREREKRNILSISQLNNWSIDKVLNELNKINDNIVNDNHSISDLLVDLYEAPWNEKYEKRGATTGIKLLNDATNGFQDGELTIIAARPSMGKTDIMLHFAKQVGWAGYIPVLFSLEMPAIQLANRLIASTGRINRGKMRNPKKYLSDDQKKQWSKNIGVLGNTNIEIFDKSGQTIAEMRAKTRKVINKYKGKKPVIFIDYLTLIKPSDFFGGNAHLQITDISKNLKNMAKDLNCPVICLAQLNRGVEKRNDKRPIMSDIRESGSVEQDADVIMFLYREKYYNKDSDKDDLELIIAKNRNGATLTVKVRYNEATGEVVDAYS